MAVQSNWIMERTEKKEKENGNQECPEREKDLDT